MAQPRLREYLCGWLSPVYSTVQRPMVCVYAKQLNAAFCNAFN